MRDLQREVGEWHVATFGPTCFERFVGPRAKFVEESAEFLEVDSMDEADREAADVVMVLLARAHRRGYDLMGYVAEKLEIVKNRDQVARDIERGIPCGDLVAAQPNTEEERR